MKVNHVVSVARHLIERDQLKISYYSSFETPKVWQCASSLLTASSRKCASARREIEVLLWGSRPPNVEITTSWLCMIPVKNLRSQGSPIAYASLLWLLLSFLLAERTTAVTSMPFASAVSITSFPLRPFAPSTTSFNLGSITLSFAHCLRLKNVYSCIFQ